ncbi:cell division protein FtsZ [Asaia bogorensis]|uniref:Cell division protein FtsZ n=1 Tax=Asaia bogorensis NBRC 16594 TaxID=1231624 RepID=A0AAN4U3Y8_9PROT|nr:cell division protein FtsZ [Asaia bogorensis]BAT19300.1 cell division protein FtsZ [Asaia bogorensis NBRC 16594]GBQ82278.1 cell division protein FtsZ [Asaia bogorensis NBRC 16594]GEL54205.1 cell division protein FtsZ [Asaia bogorensis NBRC 16594]
MTLNLTAPQYNYSDFSPRITVIGVGGGGMNAVNNMIEMQLQGVEFVVANTDAQALAGSRAERRVQLGPHLTQGLGAGAKPEIGKAAAEEAAEEISRHIDGAHMVFVTAGMGGGTGTGAAPVIAKMARDRKILTVGVVSTPFGFEGARRKKVAEAGIAELQQYVDTLIVIPNQNLFRMATMHTTLREAFKMADEVLYMGVRGVTDLMLAPGLINLDFADIRTVMAEMGKAMMGTGEAEGEDRALEAANRAISNPLLDDSSMSGARGLLINITGGDDLTLYEVDQAAERIRQEVADDATIIWGSAIDSSLNGRIRVSVVATGIDGSRAPEPEEIQPPVEPVQEAPVVPDGAEVTTSANQQPFQPASTYARQQPHYGLETQAPASAAPSPHSVPPQAAKATPQPAPSPRSGLFSDQGQRPAPEPQSQPRSLFGIVTGALRGRPAQSSYTEHNEAPRNEPTVVERAEPSRPVSSHDNSEENGLDIPAFLRRDQGR